MSKQIIIDPVTRIEGHGKITIQLDEDGSVKDALFQVTQIRGFEKFCEGRPFYEMPSLMARICGICPVSHLVASAKACDQILGVRIPSAAEKLRRVMNLAQMIQSHALSFFYLASPDLLLGMDSDPAERNIFGVLKKNPTLARDGVRLRQMGQQAIEWLAGKRIHPSWIVPGGVNERLTVEKRDQILAMIPEGLFIAQRTYDWFRGVLEKFQKEIQTFANFPTLFMGLVDGEGNLEHYDGKIRIMDASGSVIADKLEPENYQQYIGEAVEPFTYLKFPYYKPFGYDDGIYRVGPLARLNIAKRCGTEIADNMLEDFRKLGQDVVLSSFHYHFARLIEIVFGFEKIKELLESPDILSNRIRAYAEPNCSEGIGVSEAPRGTLIHHYKVDENGLMVWANLIIATGHNNLAMNRGVLQVAKNYVTGKKIPEGILNRIEAVIRAYDPCLSCSTHAVGQMPLQVDLRSCDGEIVDRISR
jgi:NAD-reducing hydrogenase large subunit